MPTITDAVDIAKNQPLVQYSFELAWLDAQLDPLALLVKDAAAKFAWGGSVTTDWVRSYSNFNPTRAAYCVFVYERAKSSRHICLVELFAAPPATPIKTESPVIETPAGWIKISPLANDPALGTLASTLVLYPEAEVLRYRPYRRCTMRVQSSNIPARIIKVFHDHQGATVNENTVAAWEAKQRGELSFNVAAPLGWEPESRRLALGLVPGKPILQELLSAQGAALSERMGRACAEIAISGIKPVSVFDASSQMTRTREYADELTTLLPQLTDRIEALLNRLAVMHSAAGQNTLRPIHGSPHAHQWLQQGTTLGLVDFDRFGLGDPELDVATFLGEMDFERMQHSPAIAQAFQKGYEAVYGVLNPDLITAYRTHKRFAKVRRAAYKPSPKIPEKVLRHLLRTEECLGIK